ncbi:hypothetical protein Rhe02_39330 [Rhizocola hellebori]|uniref:Uncharacterized protein n=1 Tax=Rhizocola hellebori TaxID=1392758 RepID=A0A8J3Q8K4_9ACTN|nr:hypothetical protein Rhe02_39330 [Rhizocola hellebori]
MPNTGVSRHWGIRSLVTGCVYTWGTTRQHAELMWAVTGIPERFEVVQRSGLSWVAAAAAVSSSPPAPKIRSTHQLRRRAARRRLQRAQYGLPQLRRRFVPRQPLAER